MPEAVLERGVEAEGSEVSTSSPEPATSLSQSTGAHLELGDATLPSTERERARESIEREAKVEEIVRTLYKLQWEDTVRKQLGLEGKDKEIKEYLKSQSEFLEKNPFLLTTLALVREKAKENALWHAQSMPESLKILTEELDKGWFKRLYSSADAGKLQKALAGLNSEGLAILAEVFKEKTGKDLFEALEKEAKKSPELKRFLDAAKSKGLNSRDLEKTAVETFRVLSSDEESQTFEQVLKVQNLFLDLAKKQFILAAGAEKNVLESKKSAKEMLDARAPGAWSFLTDLMTDEAAEALLKKAEGDDAHAAQLKAHFSKILKAVSYSQKLSISALKLQRQAEKLLEDGKREEALKAAEEAKKLYQESINLLLDPKVAKLIVKTGAQEKAYQEFLEQTAKGISKINAWESRLKAARDLTVVAGATIATGGVAASAIGTYGAVVGSGLAIGAGTAAGAAVGAVGRVGEQVVDAASYDSSRSITERAKEVGIGVAGDAWHSAVASAAQLAGMGIYKWLARSRVFGTAAVEAVEGAASEASSVFRVSLPRIFTASTGKALARGAISGAAVNEVFYAGDVTLKIGMYLYERRQILNDKSLDDKEKAKKLSELRENLGISFTSLAKGAALTAGEGAAFGVVGTSGYLVRSGLSAGRLQKLGKIGVFALEYGVNTVTALGFEAARQGSIKGVFTMENILDTAQSFLVFDAAVHGAHLVGSAGKKAIGKRGATLKEVGTKKARGEGRVEGSSGVKVEEVSVVKEKGAAKEEVLLREEARRESVEPEPVVAAEKQEGAKRQNTTRQNTSRNTEKTANIRNEVRREVGSKRVIEKAKEGHPPAAKGEEVVVEKEAVSEKAKDEGIRAEVKQEGRTAKKAVQQAKKGRWSDGTPIPEAQRQEIIKLAEMTRRELAELLRAAREMGSKVVRVEKGKLSLETALPEVVRDALDFKIFGKEREKVLTKWRETLEKVVERARKQGLEVSDALAKRLEEARKSVEYEGAPAKKESRANEEGGRADSSSQKKVETSTAKTTTKEREIPGEGASLFDGLKPPRLEKIKPINESPILEGKEGSSSAGRRQGRGDNIILDKSRGEGRGGPRTEPPGGVDPSSSGSGILTKERRIKGQGSSNRVNRIEGLERKTHREVKNSALKAKKERVVNGEGGGSSNDVGVAVLERPEVGQRKNRLEERISNDSIIIEDGARTTVREDGSTKGSATKEAQQRARAEVKPKVEGKPQVRKPAEARRSKVEAADEVIQIERAEAKGKLKLERESEGQRKVAVAEYPEVFKELGEWLKKEEARAQNRAREELQRLLDNFAKPDDGAQIKKSKEVSKEAVAEVSRRSGTQKAEVETSKEPAVVRRSDEKVDRVIKKGTAVIRDLKGDFTTAFTPEQFRAIYASNAVDYSFYSATKALSQVDTLVETETGIKTDVEEEGTTKRNYYGSGAGAHNKVLFWEEELRRALIKLRNYEVDKVEIKMHSGRVVLVRVLMAGADPTKEESWGKVLRDEGV